MKEGYIIRDKEKIHFITVTVVDWIDACLPAWLVFTRKTYNYVNSEGLVTIEIVDNPVVDVLKNSSITKYNKY